MARGGQARRRATTFPAVLILAVLQGSVRAAPEPMASFEIGLVTVIAEPGQVGLATKLAELAEPSREWTGLGRLDLTPFTLVVTADAAGYARWSGGRVPGWGAGLTVPSRRLVVIRADAGDPFGTLRHELAHLALHTSIRSRVPLWFDEGYAVVAAGEHNRMAALQLNLAVAMGRVPTLPLLNASLRGGAGDAATAYALAGSAVADLQRRHPTGSLEPLLNRLRAGERFDDALRLTTGLDAERFGESWHIAVRRRYNLGVWTLAGGGWVILALLMGFAAGWRRHADAPRRAALDVGWSLPEPDDETMTVDNGSMTTLPSTVPSLDRPAAGS